MPPISGPAPISPIRLYLGGRQWPTVPAHMQFADASETLAYDIIARGAIAMPRGFSPTRVRLEGRFFGEQRKKIPLLADPWTNPYDLCRDLADWCRLADEVGSRTLIVTGLQVSLDVLPESFQWEPVGGYGDVDYQLSLYEERQLASGSPTWRGESRPVASAPGSAGVRWSYTTVPGDTLATIATQQLGDSTRWSEIRSLNADVPQIDHEELPVGTTLVMPPSSFTNVGI